MRLALALCLSVLCRAADPSAEEIMSRVAQNQDRAQTERLQYLYDQHIKVVSRHKNGKLGAEEIADYTVIPKDKGIERKQTALTGRYLKKGDYIEFKDKHPLGDDNKDSADVSVKPAPADDGGESKGTSVSITISGFIDLSLTKGFRESLFDTKTKDGLGKDFFPLTTDEQKDLRFELAGEETINDRRAYRIRFAPKNSHEITWAGEALIDAEDFQPVTVFTHLSHRIPVAIRMLLGTDLPGLGFSVRYVRLDKDVWFPASFGAEFRIHAVFFINRIVTVSLENRNFKHTSADSKIHYEVETPP